MTEIDEKALLAAFRANHHPDAEPSSVELRQLEAAIRAYLSTTSPAAEAVEALRDTDEEETTERNPKSWAAWKRRAEAAEASLAALRSAEPVAWRDPSTAPKDGTIVLLSVRPEADGGWTPLNDSWDPYTTIGFNSLDNTGDDEWQFAGWDWCHDCFTDGAGEVIGWLPLPTTGRRG